MGYSTNNFKETLSKSIDFTDIITKNDYNSVDGNCQSFSFIKNIKNNIGADEKFTISVTNQISGFVTADLRYYKKLKDSSETLSISMNITHEVEKLNERIKACEEKCLLTGLNFE